MVSCLGKLWQLGACTEFITWFLSLSDCGSETRSTGLPGCTQISLSIYLWRLGEPVRGGVGGGKQERRRKGVEFFVSLQARNNLPSFWAIWLLQACSGLWTGDLSVLLWLHHFHTPIHFLIMIPFQVNEKTNIQDIRMLLRRHYRQLLMATYTAENTH